MAISWFRAARRVEAMVHHEFTRPVPPSLPPTEDGRFQQVSWELPGVGVHHALYLAPANGAAVLFAHGSPGSGAGFVPEARSLADAGYGALLLDLPGYGGSAGARDWGASFDQAVAAGLDFLAQRPEVDAGRIALFGYSMGTAIASRVAAVDTRVAALILLAPFTDLRSQLRAQYRSRWPGMGGVAARAALDCGVQVEELRPRMSMKGARGELPLLLIGGAEDRVVPLEMVRAIALDRPEAEFWTAPGVGHAGFAEMLGETYFARLSRFLDGALATPTGSGSSGRQTR